MSFRVIGTGSCLPKTCITNDDLAKVVDTCDDWIFTRTGIKTRYILTDDTLCEITIKAVKDCLLSSNLKATDLDYIICSTSRGDYYLPSLACVVSEAIGADCPCFDVNAACTGFVYALDVAKSYFDSGRAKHILVIGAEAMSKLVDWQDRSTCVLFGDGAGCVLLEADTKNIVQTKLTCTGNVEVLYTPSFDGNCPFNKTELKQPYMKMNGARVYKFAVNAINDDINSILELSGIKKDDINFVVTHQANMRIIEAAATKTGIPLEKFMTNIESCGNTSSASIPLVIDKLNKQNIFKDGDIIAMSGFGGGLTTGGCILQWKNK